MTNKTIMYIHGANASPISFYRIKEHLPKHNIINISYSVEDPLENTINSVVHNIKQRNNISIISHSLGGVIALLAAQECINIDKVVTMSSPLAGSRAADIMKWFFPNQLFTDINTSSPFFKKLKDKKITQPTLNYVTTGGATPLIFEKNDGVCSVESQRAIDGLNYVELPLNHFEVLLSDDVITGIKNFIFPQKQH